MTASSAGTIEATRLRGRQLRRFSTVDALAQALRDAVLDGELLPGLALTEGEVSTAYSVSRPTAKAAIRQLVAERLLRQDLNKSATVAQPDADDVIDLFRIRIPLELEIVREIITAKAIENPHFSIPSSAYAAVSDLRLLPLDSSPHEFVAADLRFHKVLAELSGSERLLNAFEDIESELHLSMLQSYTYLDYYEVAQQHEEILNTIELAVNRADKDWVPTKITMKHHLRTDCDLIATSLRD